MGLHLSACLFVCPDQKIEAKHQCQVEIHDNLFLCMYVNIKNSMLI